MDLDSCPEASQNDECETVTGPGNEPKLSKNQLKKQRRRERWLAVKQEKRRQTKQKRKQKLADMRERGEDVGRNRKSLKSNTMKHSSCKMRVVLDLSLDEYMTEKDVNSLTCQLQHSYSANRRAENPMQLYLCGLCGKTKKRLDDIGDYNGWDIHVKTQDYWEVFPKDSLVYLSSESPNILTTLSEDKVYIIGGLVDHNKHKGLCHRLAEEKGIAHAQLPISEYLSMKTRKVLAVNHVFSILLRLTEGKDWKEAFLSEMPQRKQAHLKEGDEDSSEDVSNVTSKSDEDDRSRGDDVKRNQDSPPHQFVIKDQDSTTENSNRVESEGESAKGSECNASGTVEKNIESSTGKIEQGDTEKPVDEFESKNRGDNESVKPADEESGS